MKIRLSDQELDARIDRFLKNKAKRFPELALEEHAALPYVAEHKSRTWRRA